MSLHINMSHKSSSFPPIELQEAQITAIFICLKQKGSKGLKTKPLFLKSIPGQVYLPSNNKIQYHWRKMILKTSLLWRWYYVIISMQRLKSCYKFSFLNDPGKLSYRNDQECIREFEGQHGGQLSDGNQFHGIQTSLHAHRILNILKYFHHRNQQSKKNMKINLIKKMIHVF